MVNISTKHNKMSGCTFLYQRNFYLPFLFKKRHINAQLMPFSQRSFVSDNNNKRTKEKESSTTERKKISLICTTHSSKCLSHFFSCHFPFYLSHFWHTSMLVAVIFLCTIIIQFVVSTKVHYIPSQRTANIAWHGSSSICSINVN